MNETYSAVVDPEAPVPNSPSESHELRQEVHNMLRDVAFVLAQTRRVREEILSEQPNFAKR